MSLAGLALEGGDPRDVHRPALSTALPVEHQLPRATHDPNVTFEEYIHYASITRAEEKERHSRLTAAAGPKTFSSVLKNRFSKGNVDSFDTPPQRSSTSGEKNGNHEKAVGPANGDRSLVTDAEWKNASRAARTAGWSSVFFLITTDILGPFSTPYVRRSAIL